MRWKLYNGPPRGEQNTGTCYGCRITSCSEIRRHCPIKGGSRARGCLQWVKIAVLNLFLNLRRGKQTRNNETLQARGTHWLCMIIVWTACFSGLCTLVIQPLLSMHYLQDGVTAGTMHMFQCGWGSEEGAANQVLRDPAQIHINPSTATLCRHLPLASLVGAVSGRISRQL